MNVSSLDIKPTVASYRYSQYVKPDGASCKGLVYLDATSKAFVVQSWVRFRTTLMHDFTSKLMHTKPISS